LKERDRRLGALEVAGVATWEDYGYAMELLQEKQDEN